MTSQNPSIDHLSTAPNAHPMSMIARTDTTSPSTADWVNVFGPDGYNVQPDTTRNRKIGRVHLPDVLKVGFLPLHRVDRLHCSHAPLIRMPY